jgi:hypothetical protein
MLTEKQEKELENYLFKKEEKKMKEKLRNHKKDVKKKKRKVGRPKKRGPKKKRIRRKILKIIKERPLCDFKIVTVINGKQNGYIGQYQNYSDAHKKLIELNESNNSVIFPRKYLNSGTIGVIKDEYLLLEKNRFGNKSDGEARNEFGKIVKQKITNSNKWIIRDKTTRYVEETFWVYGYDPKKERKTFSWIYENLIINSIESNYDIIRILIYKNKLVIKYDNKPLVMVMCKNKSDCIRMYNIISDKVRTNKIKQVLCIGIYNVICDARKDIEKDKMN